MDRKAYDKLIQDIGNGYLNCQLASKHFATNAVNNVLIAEGIDIPEPAPTPLGDQVWAPFPVRHLGTGRVQYEICDSGKPGTPILALALTEEMRDIMLGIPGLVKALEEHMEEFPNGNADLLDALKDMGVE